MVLRSFCAINESGFTAGGYKILIPRKWHCHVQDDDAYHDNTGNNGNDAPRLGHGNGNDTRHLSHGNDVVSVVV